MNYLAHLYLSGNDHHLMVGNFIGDAVKGNLYKQFPGKIREGVLLHRQIDTYTDNHSIIREAKSYFAKSYGKYSGVVVDILFDHFLASSWAKYHPRSLPNFVDFVNFVLLSYFEILPYRIQIMMPFWVKHRWPELYSTKKGLLRVLTGMSYYTSMPQNVKGFQKSFDANQLKLRKLFDVFFKDIRSEFSKRT